MIASEKRTGFRVLFFGMTGIVWEKSSFLEKDERQVAAVLPYFYFTVVNVMYDH